MTALEDYPVWRPECVPQELQICQQWVGYRLVTNNASGRINKLPINADGAVCDQTDPENWTTFEEAVAMWLSGLAHGFGFVFSTEDRYVGIDLDHVRDPLTGTVDPFAAKIIESIDSYTEVSVSGTGLHIICKGDIPRGRNKFDNVEIYAHSRYFTVTGHVFHPAGLTPFVQDRPEELRDLYERLLASSKTGPGGPTASGNTLDQESRPPVKLSVNHAAAVPGTALALIRQYPILRQLWDRSGPAPQQTDETPSGYCYILAGRLARLGISAQEILDTLVAYRRDNADRPKADIWFRKEVARGLSWAADNPSISSTDAIGKAGSVAAVFEHWRGTIGLSTLDLAILASLASNTYDGVHVSRSTQAIAKDVLVGDRQVMVRISAMERFGCLTVLEKPVPGRPKKYRLNMNNHAHSHDIPNPGNPTPLRMISGSGVGVVNV